MLSFLDGGFYLSHFWLVETFCIDRFSTCCESCWSVTMDFLPLPNGLLCAIIWLGSIVPPDADFSSFCRGLRFPFSSLTCISKSTFAGCLFRVSEPEWGGLALFCRSISWFSFTMFSFRQICFGCSESASKPSSRCKLELDRSYPFGELLDRRV